MQGLIRPISLSLPILGSMFLLSCATLSKQQCLIGDWQTIGYNDGVAGYSSERLASHSKACAKAHVTPDYLAWSAAASLVCNNTVRATMRTMSVAAGVG